MFVVKECTKCNEYKLLSEFSIQKSGAFGRRSICNICCKKHYESNKEYILERNKKNYEVNKERRRLHSNQRYKANRERILERNNKNYEVNKERILEHQKQYYKNNKELKKQYREKNKERINLYSRQYREKNKERIKAYREENKEKMSMLQKKHYEKNKERILEYKKQYEAERKENDSLFRLKRNIRSLISISINRNGYAKRSKTQEILGCDWNTFKIHIERQFTKGMSWENRSEWHIDHIYPISKAKSEEEAVKLNHYTNLRPMWAKDNLLKKAKIIEHQMKLPI